MLNSEISLFLIFSILFLFSSLLKYLLAIEINFSMSQDILFSLYILYMTIKKLHLQKALLLMNILYY